MPGAPPESASQVLWVSLPFVILVKLWVLHLVGVPKLAWRCVGWIEIGRILLAVLLGKLGQKPGMHRSRNLARLEEALKDLGRVTPILVLDDAQDYPPGALEEVRLLLGLNLPRQPVFALVLIGDLYLQETLRLAHLKSLGS